MVGIRDFFSPPFSPSEAEASLMAVEEKKAAPTAPPWTHYIFGSSTRLSEVLPLVVNLHLLLQWRGAGHRRRPRWV